MRKESLAGVALALLGAGQAVFGQAVPGVPGAPVAAGPVAAATPAAGTQNIWSMLCLTPEQKAACKEKICRSGLGQLLNGFIAPASAATGGVIKPLCPPVLPSDLLKPSDSAEGAAAAIKADEAAAKARRAAVRYLGTVDCRYWPEATEALVNALRADRNECVRIEAALSLGRGCCCNKATIKALTISVNCSDEDGNPPEASPRVRELAAAALEHCLECYTERVKLSPEGPGELPPPTEEKPRSKVPDDPDKEGPKDKKKDDKEAKPTARSKEIAREDLTPALYYKKVSKQPWEKIIEPARKTLSRVSSRPVAARTTGRSLSEIVGRSMTAQPQHVRVETVPPPVASRPAVTQGMLPPLFRKAPAPVEVPVSVPAPAAKPPVKVVEEVKPSVEPVREESKPVSNETVITPPVAAPIVAPPLSATERVLPPLPGEAPVTAPPPAPPASTPPADPVQAPREEIKPPTATITNVGPTPKTAFVPPPVVAQTPTTALVQTTYAPTYKVTPVRPVAAATTTHSTDELLNVFHETADIQRREWVVQQLARVPGAASDHRVVALLVQSAEWDPSALVRLACLETIGTLGVTHGRLGEVLGKLQADADARVRIAAREVAARR